MILRIYSTNKVKNSTKRPSTTELLYETSDFYFKDSSSIHNPVIIVSNPAVNGYIARIAVINTVHYFIDDVITLNNGLWELHCSQDLLADSKIEIANTSFYFERTADKLNPVIGDQYVTPIYGRRSSGVSEMDDTPGYNSAGCYFVQIIDRFPMVVYVMAQTEFLHFMERVAAFFTVADKIKFVHSVKYCKLNFDTFPGNTTRAMVVGNETITFSNDIKYGSTPVWYGFNNILYGQDWNVYGDWRDSDPRFSQYSIEVYGEKQDLNPAYRKTLHHYSAVFNPMDTTMYLRFYDSLNCLIFEVQKQIGTDIPLERVGYNPLQIVKSTLGMIPNALTGSAGSISNSVGVLETVLTPEASRTSAETNLAQLAYYDKIRFFHYVMTSSPELPTQYGYPYFNTSKLTNLGTSGYYRTLNAKFSGPNTPEENDRINELLNGGFYYE